MAGVYMQPNRAPVVSVVMPVYNASATLARAVQSVRLQSWNNWELILIEDGSGDASADLCASLAAEDARIRALYQPGNTGAAAARNAGLAVARGRYVAFLDADDEWLPEKLSRQIPFMQNEGAAFSYTGFWRARAGGRRHRVHVPPWVDRTQLLHGNVIGCLSVVYDRAYFGNVSMPPLRMHEDFAFWLQLLEQAPLARGLDEALAVYHVTPGSLTSARGRAVRATWGIYRSHLRLPLYRAAWYLSSHVLRRLRRG